MSQEFGAPTKPKSSIPVWVWFVVVPCGCFIVGVIALAALLFPVFSQARERARNVSCLSNVKQQELGILMYAQDYDQYLPAANQWMDATSPYRHSELSLHCPAAAQSTSDLYGYAYNKGISARLLPSVADPQTTPMTYDSTVLTRNAFDYVSSLPRPGRHVGENNVGYADGHAKHQSDKYIPQ